MFLCSIAVAMVSGALCQQPQHDLRRGDPETDHGTVQAARDPRADEPGQHGRGEAGARRGTVHQRGEVVEGGPLHHGEHDDSEVSITRL